MQSKKIYPQLITLDKTSVSLSTSTTFLEVSFLKLDCHLIWVEYVDQVTKKQNKILLRSGLIKLSGLLKSNLFTGSIRLISNLCRNTY